jgi:hypothetical protein
LATDDAVMAIGGFNGTDPAPTLAQFEQDVREGKIHYFIAGGGSLGGPGLGGPGSIAGGRGGNGTAATSDAGSASTITQWVESHFTAKTVGGATVYDLTSAG